jgi:hypothetical protein
MEDGIFERENNPRRSLLSMTAEDHRRIGSTLVGNEPELQLLRENPGKTLAELLSPEQLRERIARDLAILDELHREAKEGNAMSKRILEDTLKRTLGPDLAYLHSVNKLPEEFAQLDLKQRYAL